MGIRFKEDFIEELFNFYNNEKKSLRNMRLSKNDGSVSHSNIISYATYSPWLDDVYFMQIFEKVKNNTLVDIYRCYELFSLITNNEGLEGDVLEVGVWKGGTGSILAKALNQVNASSKIYLADTFSGVVKAGKNDTIYKGGEHSDTSVQEVELLLNKVDAKNVTILKGIFPNKVNIPLNTKLRLCHIDVDTYDSAKEIFDSIWNKIVVGGAVVFDDYGFFGCEGITRLCNEMKNTYKNSRFIHNINGHAIFIKISE